MANKDVVFQYYGLFAEGDFAKMKAECFHPDVTWTMPGHVEVEFAGAYASPQDDCVLAFPSPMFSYEVTAP